MKMSKSKIQHDNMCTCKNTLKFKVGLYNLRLIKGPGTDFCRPPVVQV